MSLYSTPTLAPNLPLICVKHKNKLSDLDDTLSSRYRLLS